MTDGRFIGVIDIGKTNVKYAIVDANNWSEVAVRKMRNLVLATGAYPHFDIEGIWVFLTGAISELQADHPVSALSITTHGASVALLDADGALALPVLDYEHSGPDSMAGTYDAVRPPFSDTGSPRLPMGLNLGAQLHWQKHAFADAFGRVCHILTYPQYWAYRLTGVMANEVTSLGCHTDLWNPWTRDFSNLVDSQGWRPLMAPVHKAGDIIGTVTADVASTLGLPEGVPVACGIHDSNASLYPHLMAQQAPFSVVSTGTWVICMAMGGKPIDPDPGRDTLVNVNALGDPVPSARFMGGREFDQLTQDIKPGCSLADMVSLLESGIMLLPAIENRSGPFQGCNAHWHGGELSDDAARFAAVSIYLAMMTSVCLDLIGADGPSLVEGPFAANETYLAMLEAATGRPAVASLTSATGTSIGAAMLVGHAGNTAGIAAPSDSIATRTNHPQARGYAETWRTLADRSAGR